VCEIDETTELSHSPALITAVCDLTINEGGQRCHSAHRASAATAWAGERDGGRKRMHFQKFSFGSIWIDGATYEYDVVIDRGKIRRRKKKASRKFRGTLGHTPLSVKEKIPWKCGQLVVGTGAYGRLPVMQEVKVEAKRRKVELLILPTAEAIEALNRGVG
jgi:hypothetical protein